MGNSGAPVFFNIPLCFTLVGDEMCTDLVPEKGFVLSTFMVPWAISVSQPPAAKLPFTVYFSKSSQKSTPAGRLAGTGGGGPASALSFPSARGAPASPAAPPSLEEPASLMVGPPLPPA